MNNGNRREQGMDEPQWPDLAIGLYDRLTGRQAEIAYQLDDFEIQVPSAAGANAVHATWRVNGTLRIRTRDHA